jgi:hypothetical protein
MITFPNLDIVMLIASASASSLPLNHLDTIADYVTFMLSPPRPNTNLPTTITLYMVSVLFPHNPGYPPIVNIN